LPACMACSCSCDHWHSTCWQRLCASNSYPPCLQQLPTLPWSVLFTPTSHASHSTSHQALHPPAYICPPNTLTRPPTRSLPPPRLCASENYGTQMRARVWYRNSITSLWRQKKRTENLMQLVDAVSPCCNGMCGLRHAHNMCCRQLPRCCEA